VLFRSNPLRPWHGYETGCKQL